MNEYTDFLASKVQPAKPSGFDVDVDADYLFPFQRDCVKWALRQGRAALFEDTGLGKTRQQLEWARHVVEHARRTGESPRVLLLAPLAVGTQTVREAAECGIPGVRIARHQSDVEDGITVTNYDALHHFEADTFTGVVLDESSILKAFSGRMKQSLVSAFARTPYRLACTATPAPNDHLELGNHSEFLGVLSSHQMIARWFINDTSTFGTYKLKGHAVGPFWDWVCSWARCVGKPSDIGKYSDDGYILPELNLHRHVVGVDIVEGRGGALFRIVDTSATNLHREKRRTAKSRALRVAELIHAEPHERWLVWVDTDYDADAIRGAIPDVVEVRGSDDPTVKSERLLGFADGKIRVLVTKPKIAGYGMNWQGCARVAFVGPSYSYEQFYQAVRRCWRFGQSRAVDVHVIQAATEGAVWETISRKAGDHDGLKLQMFAASRRAQSRAAQPETYNPTVTGRLPDWLTTEPSWTL